MTECLVTKFKGTINDSSLSKVGELRLKVSKVSSPTGGTNGNCAIRFKFTKAVKLQIVGDAHFTDTTLSQDLGKEVTSTINSDYYVWIIGEDCEFIITDKYALIYLDIFNSGLVKVFNINDLRYSTSLTYIELSSNSITGDLSALSNLTSLSLISITSNSITGDLSALSNLTSLKYVYIKGSKFTGDLSALSNLTSVSQLVLENFLNLTGDFSALSNLTALTSISIYSEKIQGSIDNFKGMTGLKSMRTSGKITGGDLAAFPSPAYYLEIGKDSAMTWSTKRESTANIFGLSGSPTIDNVDKMLQDLANCQKAIPNSSVWLSTITITGTRTSASDSALQTLQEKGYTVTINPT